MANETPFLNPVIIADLKRREAEMRNGAFLQLPLEEVREELIRPSQKPDLSNKPS